MQTLFAGWHSLGRTLVLCAVGYVALLVLLRISGKRTLAKMNVFDFVVTVALGSVLASGMLSPTTSAADMVGAFAALIALQFVFSWLTRRSKGLEELINGRPTILLYRGRMLAGQLRGERVTEEEVRAAMRAAGVGRLEDADAVVLETDGQFTVMREVPAGPDSTLCDVEGVPAEAPGPAAADPARPRGQSERRRRERRRRWMRRP